MTIKEIEVATGMTRANIRFYESEGLITPARNENDYRVYSKEDLQILKRIKLLRSLHIPLDKIKKLHSGEQTLEIILAEHLVRLGQEKERIEQSQRICKIMKEDGVCYQTLNAQRYLNFYEQIGNDGNKELEQDILPTQSMPVRRFFARMLDYYLYFSIWTIFLGVALKINLGQMGIWGDLLRVFLSVILMKVLEPIMLCLLGTTLGKWILGMRILDEEGNRLSYRDARERTGDVLWKGVGFYIPIFQWIRMWKCYKECEYHSLDWEYKSTIALKDDRNWRTVAYCGICITIFMVTLITSFIPNIPQHRGDITVSEFQENYEYYNGYYGILADEWWKEESVSDEGVVVDVSEDMMKPKVTFLEEDGIMKGLHMELEVTSKMDTYISTYEDEMILSMLAFICAQDGYHILDSTWYEILKLSELMPYEEYVFEKYGVKVQRVVESEGYSYIEGTKMMLSNEDESGNHYYRLQFQIEKTVTNNP